MNRGIIVLFAALSLMLTMSAQAAKNPWEQKLPFKSAEIHYEISGMETGTEVLYIREHGKQTARYHTGTSKMMGMTMKSDTIQITDPDWVYNFDLVEGTGTKTINPQKLMIEEFNKLSKADQKKVIKNAEEQGNSYMVSMGAKVTPKAKEIMGYQTDMVTVMGSTSYNIHETPIALLTETNMMGISMKSVAIKFDKKSVSKDHFKLPPNITPRPDPEADRMARNMAQQTIAMLVDPEAHQQKQGGTDSQQPEGTDTRSEEQKQMDEAMNALKGLFGN